MAPVRKPAAKAAPIKTNKKHGPKRHMFRSYGPMKHTMAQAGVLTKYYDIESFALSLASRGFKGNIDALWMQFRVLPTKKAKDEFLKNLSK